MTVTFPMRIRAQSPARCVASSLAAVVALCVASSGCSATSETRTQLIGVSSGGGPGLPGGASGTPGAAGSSSGGPGIISIGTQGSGGSVVGPAPDGGTSSSRTPITIDACGAGNAANLSPEDVKKLAAGGQQGTLKWLYPYDGTVFPRGLKAPLFMWDAGMSAAATAVYVHIKSG